MRLVVITQAVDPDDPALGATVDKVRALAARVDEVVVLALRSRPADLPPNVRVRSFAARGPVLKAVRLLAALVPELRRRPVAVLAHMAPAYAVVAALATRPLRIPLLLWFTHWRASRLLQLAERVSTRVLSVNERSFPLRSSKLVATGHGVEVPQPAVATTGNSGTLRLLALGRTSPAKGLETLVDAIGLVRDLPVAAEIRGPSLTVEEREHRAALAARISSGGLDGRVIVDGPVDRSDVRSLYARSDALVNNMRAGALDKVVFEAAGAGLPVLVASDGFSSLVDGVDPPLRFRQDDAGELADRIRSLYGLGAAGRAAVGATLRARVQSAHSVEHWADEVVAAAR
ncbi:MAG: glycosyltransferase family 4 protein [Gaiellaceae bacterium]